jgi:hypothetical protein
LGAGAVTEEAETATEASVAAVAADFFFAMQCVANKPAKVS